MRNSFLEVVCRWEKTSVEYSDEIRRCLNTALLERPGLAICASESPYHMAIDSVVPELSGQLRKVEHPESSNTWTSKRSLGQFIAQAAAITRFATACTPIQQTDMSVIATSLVGVEDWGEEENASVTCVAVLYYREPSRFAFHSRSSSLVLFTFTQKAPSWLHSVGILTTPSLRTTSSYIGNWTQTRGNLRGSFPLVVLSRATNNEPKRSINPRAKNSKVEKYGKWESKKPPHHCESPMMVFAAKLHAQVYS
eukprot:1189281-Prorocentrum_minimum.AAC.1